MKILGLLIAFIGATTIFYILTLKHSVYNRSCLL